MKKMKMEYFTKKGGEQVKAKYNNEIGNSFHFDATEAKYKLDEIIEQLAAACDDCYYIKFNSFGDNSTLSLTIDKFMALNKFNYNFYDFEIKTIVG